jgi:hypothetical protein
MCFCDLCVAVANGVRCRAYKDSPDEAANVTAHCEWSRSLKRPVVMLYASKDILPGDCLGCKAADAGFWVRCSIFLKECMTRGVMSQAVCTPCVVTSCS